MKLELCLVTNVVVTLPVLDVMNLGAAVLSVVAIRSASSIARKIFFRNCLEILEREVSKESRGAVDTGVVL